MRWPVALLAAATGCSQLFGLEPPTRGGPGDDAATGSDSMPPGIDASPDVAVGATCIDKWMSPAGPSFSTVTSLSINTTAEDYGPFVSRDALEIEFSRNAEIYMATRATPS